MGRRVFERAVADAESLADVADAPGVEYVFFEEFLYVSAQAYEESTGRRIPEYTGLSVNLQQGRNGWKMKTSSSGGFPGSGRSII